MTEAQARWFRETKPEEELFDAQADPHEIHDLAGEPKYAENLKELREACEQRVKVIADKNIMPEPELIQQIWPNMEQPATAVPSVNESDGMITVICETPGASIGYKIVDPGQETDGNNWEIYTEPFNVPDGKEVVVIAHRIGFSPSEPVRKRW